MSEKMNFKAEVNKMLNIVVNSLYSEKYIFLRELISNASDACDKLKYLMLTNPKAAKNNGELKIVITPNAEENTLKIADNGIGMNKDDLINHLGTIAKSGTSDFVADMKENGSAVDLIGQFGVGFYSAFMVADKVEIVTKKAGEEKAYKWVSDGIDGFEIEETQKDEIGTEIKLFLKKEDKDFTDTIYLRHLITTYSDHISYPIYLNLGKDGEEKINQGLALWARNKSEITKEQYKDFYQHISHNFDEPWLTMHFKAEGNIEYSALLYIPSQQPYDLFQPDKKQGLKLYVNKVFVSDKVEELMPNYLRFVKGVVDSSDLPLNISREMLQQNILIEKIKHGIVSRLLKDLKKRAEKYDDYIKFWNNFGIVLKEGIYEDFANREEIAALSLFASTKTKDKLTTLDAYIERMPKEQQEIYYITGDDVNILANNPQLEVFKQKGIEVLLLVDPIDEFWTQMLLNYKGKTIKHIAQASAELNFDRKEQKADQKQFDKLISEMSAWFKDDVAKVEGTEKLTSSPVSLTTEKGQMNIHLERLMRNHQQQTAFTSSRILEINPYHPLIIKMAEALDNKSKKSEVEKVAKILLDQAKIAEGEPIKDPSFYSATISDYILKSFSN
ncbi:MAG: molecular chaperone HtpG [Alphaproteobacteria bacterium]|nr:molecular chaperone HtpG [Alphaproteobacteria bacterium]